MKIADSAFTSLLRSVTKCEAVLNFQIRSFEIHGLDRPGKDTFSTIPCPEYTTTLDSNSAPGYNDEYSHSTFKYTTE